MGGRSSVLIAAIVLGFAAALSAACGTLLGIQPDDTPVASDGGDGGNGDLDAAPMRATGDACVWDDPGSKFSDICGFGP